MHSLSRALSLFLYCLFCGIETEIILHEWSMGSDAALVLMPRIYFVESIVNKSDSDFVRTENNWRRRMPQFTCLLQFDAADNVRHRDRDILITAPEHVKKTLWNDISSV